MGRPFIEFIQSQVVPWSQGLYGGSRAEVDVRMLSLDEGTGASSTLIRYPAGWAQAEPQVLDVDEELFVLAGDLNIGDTVHTKYGYAHLPAGYVRQRMSSDTGAVVMTFFSGEPRDTGSSSGCDEARLVESVNAFDGEWTGNFHPQFPPGAGRKFLRRDPYDGEETWVLGTMPLRWGLRAEKHPVVEEMYLLAGELVGHVGVMKAGAYFWRPEEEWHGPFGSPTGNLMLFRTKGGPLSTVYEDEDREFSWTPEHRPILPEELQEIGGTPWAGGCLCY
jgi:hypothetical protein